jgi:PTS system nitrogen regulatory IIA component
MARTDQENEVMTLAEVAAYLQLAERTVLRMAQRGEVPATKVASQWRFLRPAVRDWLAGRMQSMAPAELEEVAGRGRTALPLMEVVRPELMNLGVSPGPKEQVLAQLVEPVRASGFAREPERLLAALVERERMMTTAVGHGVALPHPRHVLAGMFAEPGISLGVCREGTDFGAVDGEPVHLFFLICATREENHLQLMAKVSWLTQQQDVRERLAEASSWQEAADEIARAAEGLDPMAGAAGKET